MVFHTSVGKLHYSLIIVCFLSSVAFFAATAYRMMTDAGGVIMLAAFGSTSLAVGIFYIMLFRSMRYILEKDGIRLPGSVRLLWWGLQDFIPYSSVMRFYESREVTRAVGFSFDQVWIDFRDGHGRKDGAGLSPKNKQLFISELTKRTGIPISLGPYADE